MARACPPQRPGPAGRGIAAFTAITKLTVPFRQRCKPFGSAVDTRLSLRQASLKQQFSNLEVTLQKAKSQGQWLSGQLAALR